MQNLGRQRCQIRRATERLPPPRRVFSRHDRFVRKQTRELPDAGPLPPRHRPTVPWRTLQYPNRSLTSGNSDGDRWGVVQFTRELLREPHLTSVPHRAWFGFSFEMPPATTVVYEARETNHTLVIGTAAAVDVKWIHRGRDRLYRHGLDQVAFFASDNEAHTRVIRSGEVPSSSYLLKIPRWQLIDLAGSDEADIPSDYPHLLPREDAVLRDCMVRLASTTGCGVTNDMGSKIAARALILRLIELLGGYAPDWHEDSSVFPLLAMNRIVEYIASHMHRHIGLVEIASLVGLSPSHCARKFRRTEGLSLERFVNRRRLVKALELLRNSSTPLSLVALDLGFCSQSHFTRLFSSQTGMTPAKYRKQFKPIVG